MDNKNTSGLRNISGFMGDHKLRIARSREKRKIILGFLKKEIFSHEKVLSELLGIQQIATVRALKKLEAEGYVTAVTVGAKEAFIKPVRLWGITLNGFDFAFQIDDVKNPDGSMDYSKYKPKKFTQADADRKSLASINHTLLCQEAHVYAIKQGFQWEPARALPGQGDTKASGLRWDKYPDGLIIGDKTSAVEIEITKKTPSAYNSICMHHINNIERGYYDNVLYFVKNRRSINPFKLTLHNAFVQNSWTLEIDDDTEIAPKDILTSGYFAVHSIVDLRAVLEN